MDDLSETFDSSFHVTLEENDTNIIHPRYSQYKLKSQKNSQAERRRVWLENQKEKRLDVLNCQRDIGNGELVNSRVIKVKKIYKNYVMLSEWLVDVPEDLCMNWIFKPCPEGKRILVVAERGRTTAYARNGHTVLEFHSLLPGGTCGSSDKTLLDCIWCPYSKTIYVLDVIFWGCLLISCEAEFRFFWLHNKLTESPLLSVSGRKNNYKIMEIQTCGNLESALAVHPYYEGNNPRLDGIIFYHKEGLYTSGKRCPLVTWLKPFMLPPILNISVNPEYLNETPPKYQKMEVSESSSKETTASDEGQKMSP